jgi:hypothetical protein
MHQTGNDFNDIELAVSNLLKFNEVFRETSPEKQVQMNECTHRIIDTFKTATPDNRLRMVERVEKWCGQEIAKRPTDQYAGHYAGFFNGIKTLYDKSQQSPELASKVQELLEKATKESSFSWKPK